MLEITWDLRGIYLGFIWDLFGIYLGFIWDLLGIYLGFTWDLFKDGRFFQKNSHIFSEVPVVGLPLFQTITLLAHSAKLQINIVDLILCSNLPQ